jgi:hypothetical protein
VEDKAGHLFFIWLHPKWSKFLLVEFLYLTKNKYKFEMHSLANAFNQKLQFVVYFVECSQIENIFASM